MTLLVTQGIFAVIPAPVWAAAWTILGALLLKAGEKWLNKNIEYQAERKNYRDEIKELNQRVDQLEAQITEWRKRTFNAEEQVHRLRSQMIQAGIDPGPAV